MKTGSGGREGDPQVPDGHAPGPELPAWKAFVIQFSRDADAHGGGFCGRIEHLISGRRSRFTSRDDLLAILERELEDLDVPGD